MTTCEPLITDWDLHHALRVHLNRRGFLHGYHLLIPSHLPLDLADPFLQIS